MHAILAPPLFAPDTCRLLLLAKAPAPGRVKTRLCPPLSFEQAARLAEAFLLDTLALLRQARFQSRYLAYSGDCDWFSQVAPDFQSFAQTEGDLGTRLQQAFQQVAVPGSSVICIGSDSPHLPVSILEQAEQALEAVDVVLGPAQDGGYYLVGARQAFPIFVGMPMSTPQLLQVTLQRLQALGLSWRLLPQHSDLDTWSDVQQQRQQLPPSSSRVLQQLEQELRSPQP
ncbi:TIGR04282 family arsenosugar biosynthesis glycosyltransferase [Leptolyngbya sp. FACHB-261]|uniref:TIGR04282 family arsenosugar biosynthesis glycosyltransferase n=1 Tax=Leptolyngbya sp. FACHB-261 TaxID=2692806 RepID=UPI001689E342|nr:TIGR04282 family arsenosugar biosynthesis glycosyltransferase [Leptolyngbya sp. FACHB-261]MBD2104653.1 TIGR04282 family arsenosugar biosynthesis glycosyltransferase [Leptolyngbya sp. FACHB-261]